MDVAQKVLACVKETGERFGIGYVISVLRGETSDRVLALAKKTDPQCRQQSIANTEMLEVHPDGKAAEELWIVEQCGRRMRYVVSFPPKRPTGTSLGFSVRPER